MQPFSPFHDHERDEAAMMGLTPGAGEVYYQGMGAWGRRRWGRQVEES